MTNSFLGTVSNVLASRALSTIYTNDTGHTLFCLVGFQSQIKNSGDTAMVYVLVDSLAQAYAGVAPFGGVSPQGQFYYIVPFVVPAGKTYQVNSTVNGTGVVQIIKWIESF